MMYLLSFTILLLVGAIVYLSVDFRKSRLSHIRKMQRLQQLMVRLSDNQHIQDDKIQLSESLKEKLRSANTVLSNDILTMMKEFIETLSKNNLLKK